MQSKFNYSTKIQDDQLHAEWALPAGNFKVGRVFADNDKAPYHFPLKPVQQYLTYDNGTRIIADHSAGNIITAFNVILANGLSFITEYNPIASNKTFAHYPDGISMILPNADKPHLDKVYVYKPGRSMREDRDSYNLLQKGALEIQSTRTFSNFIHVGIVNEDLKFKYPDDVLKEDAHIFMIGHDEQHLPLVTLGHYKAESGEMTKAIFSPLSPGVAVAQYQKYTTREEIITDFLAFNLSESDLTLKSWTKPAQGNTPVPAYH